MILKTPLTDFDLTELYDYAKVSNQPDTVLEMVGKHAVSMFEEHTGYALRDLQVSILDRYRKLTIPYLGVANDVQPTLKYNGTDVNFDDYFEIVDEYFVPKFPPEDAKIEIVYKATPVIFLEAVKTLVFRLATYFYDNRTTEIPVNLLLEIKKFRRWRL